MSVEDLAASGEPCGNLLRRRRHHRQAAGGSVGQHRQQPPRRRGAADDQAAEPAARQPGRHHLRVERRGRETAAAALRIDDLADVRLGDVHALPARRADQRVVVQRGDRGNAARPRAARKVEGQIEQVVDVQDLRLDGVEHGLELFPDSRRRVGVLEAVDLPVVDDLDDRQPLVHTPADGAVGSRRVELRGHEEHVVPARQLTAQLERIDLRSGPVPRQEIVDRVQEPQPRHGLLPRTARASCWLRSTHSRAPGVVGEIAIASSHIRTARS